MTATTDTCLLAAAAITVVVPLVGAAAMAMGFRRGSPRGFAVAVAAVSLLASLAITLFWSRSDAASMAFGDPLGGGTLICIDGITAVLLPYVALVELAILLVAPRRSLEQSAVTRILFGAAATYALFLTSHPIGLVVLWCATALPTWISVRSTPGGRAAARVFGIAMAAATVCMAIGSVLLLVDPPWAVAGGSASLSGGSAGLSEGSVSGAPAHRPCRPTGGRGGGIGRALPVDAGHGSLRSGAGDRAAGSAITDRHARHEPVGAGARRPRRHATDGAQRRPLRLDLQRACAHGNRPRIVGAGEPGRADPARFASGPVLGRVGIGIVLPALWSGPAHSCGHSIGPRGDCLACPARPLLPPNPPAPNLLASNLLASNLLAQRRPLVCRICRPDVEWWLGDVTPEKPTQNK